MVNVVTFYQEKERFGKNQDTLNQLKNSLKRDQKRCNILKTLKKH